MPARRELTMRQVRHILRLAHDGVSTREIGRRIGVARSTIQDNLKRAAAAELSWPLLGEMTDDALERLLFARTDVRRGSRRLPEPDWARLAVELKRAGVTLTVLWDEYRAAHPEGYGYSRFCDLFRSFQRRLSPTMRQNHTPGDKAFVDFSGKTLPIVDRRTGETREAQIFIAVLGASSFTYAEAVWTQTLPDWIGAHVRMFDAFGGAPRLIVPDNLKAGVHKASFYDPEINRSYAMMASHYGVDILPARPRRPRDKAKVENGVRFAQSCILGRLRNQTFFSLAEANAAIEGVYIRQSTQTQVLTNLKSQRRQYDLVDVARQQGFRQVEVIDDDLGLSASGTVARPGFERLVAWLCTGEVGAVLCFDASRLARNGRDWHHLLELCGLVEARVIDHDGVYDPCRPNDRLLLGMKGTISEFELGVLRARMLDAARAKAARGELRISVPIGYVWHREAGLGFDPDLRVQEAIRLIFARFREIGSARQVLLSLTKEELCFPRPSDGRRMTSFDWTPIRYRNVIAVLKNPFYAGAYVYGKSEKRTEIVDGRPRKSYGHGRPMEEWEVLLKDHHEGYIAWAEFERNQAQLAANAYGRIGGTKSARGGRALLAGLLTCGRCGRGLAVSYTGRPPGRPTYRCDRPNLMLGLPRCLGFGGARVDAAVAAELLRAVEPMAIEAAMEAERVQTEAEAERRRMAALDLEQARYEATLAERRYAACDPDNRLIAATLEKNWEAALQRVEACKVRLDVETAPNPAAIPPDFTGLADDLEAAWNAPGTSMRARQRLVRALIRDIVADVDEEARDVVLTIHWQGGQHSQLRVRKPKTGEHGCRTPEEALAVMRSMAGRWPDEHIAASLNRMGVRTGQGQSWTARRVGSIRKVHGIHAYRSAEKNGAWLTMTEAARKLGVTNHVIRRLIRDGILPAEQVVPGAPYQIRAADLETDAAIAAAARKPRPYRDPQQKTLPMFSDT